MACVLFKRTTRPYILLVVCCIKGEAKNSLKRQVFFSCNEMDPIKEFMNLMQRNKTIGQLKKRDQQNESYCQGRTIHAIDDTNNNGLLLVKKNQILVLLLTFFS